MPDPFRLDAILAHPVQRAMLLFALSLVELLLAFGVGFALFYLGYWLGCRFAIRCYDSTGFAVLFVVFPIAVVVALAYWIAAQRLRARLRPRLKLDAFALAVVIALLAYLLIASIEPDPPRRVPARIGSVVPRESPRAMMGLPVPVREFR